MFLRFINFTQIALACLSAGVAGASPPTADDFAARPRISSIALSPSGNQFAALVSINGAQPDIALWDVDALDQPPKILPKGPDELMFIGLSYLKEDRLWLSVLQHHLPRYSNGRYPAFIIDTKTQHFQPFYWQIIKQIREKNVVIVNNGQHISRLNLEKSGENYIFENIFLKSQSYFNYKLSFEGKQILSREQLNYDIKGPYISIEFRNSSQSPWIEHFRNYARNRSDIDILHFQPDNTHVILRAAFDTDHAALYSYSLADKRLQEKLFSEPNFDVDGDVLSQDPSTYGDIIGYRYNGPTGSEIQWISADTQALVSGVKKALGEVDTEIDWTDPGTGAVSRITVPKNFSVHPLHFSANLQTWIFEKDGPTTPPEYYLYRVGKPVKLIGRSRPQLDPRLLGQSQLAQITTRDGLKIPAFVHKPESSIWGPGPYPAIVLPHGGPWTRDSWAWDSTGWVAYFTARGYVVIQPQYRGSTGWGGALWAAGDNQWGLKMSDDLDDAANWLVSNGLAKPGHIVLHGYSYGGFAAYVAATRGPSSPYRCVIAGGAGGDLTRWRLYASESHYLREYQGVTMDGYSPIDHIEKVNVPLLVYHSELDHNVDLQEAKMMVDRLQAAGKAVKFIELKDQDHTIYTWSPANTATILTSIDDFLTHDCGQGGVNGPDAVATR